MPDPIDAKAVDAAIEPEAQHIVHRFADSRIAPIEIGLLAQKGVVIVLGRRFIEAPGGTAEIAHPTVGRGAVGLWIAPNVPIALRIVARGAALDKPRMLIGRVVRNEVDNDLKAARMCLFDESIEICKRPEDRIDAAIIGDVVAEVRHRRRIDRGDPERVDLQPLQIVEAAANPFEIADAVAVTVLERARIDLIDDAALPPNGFGHAWAPSV